MRWARLIREQKGESLRETAKAAGIDVGSLSKFERDLVDLRASALDRLAAHLGVPIDTLRRQTNGVKEPAA